MTVRSRCTVHDFVVLQIDHFTFYYDKQNADDVYS